MKPRRDERKRPVEAPRPAQNSGVVLRDSAFEAPAPAPLDRLLRDHYAGASWNDVRRLVKTGKVTVGGSLASDPAAVVRAGTPIAVRMAAPKRAAGPVTQDAIVHLDAHVVVVEKPAGIATVPYEDERDTLDRLVQGLLRKRARPGTSVAPLGVVQRLDKDTSGLLVFARTTTAKRGLQQQLRVHTVHRRYLALAHGDVRSETFRSRLVDDRGDGFRGSTDNPLIGREAITHVRRLESFGVATLVECRLETGRTHQIRIHLSEAGHPLVGERVYQRAYEGPVVDAPRLMLHAAELGFEHPVSGLPLSFESPLPADFQGVLAGLRRKA
ncbi:MAG TPA: RluA family pseudouridine synthase [Polyangiaceae bacterium]|nr:RluA family pseudouridine synthase [Polyangiaceae bacterium]